MKPDSLGVIGLGAIGGSVAWQAVRAGVKRVVGFSPATRESVEAARAGAVTEIAAGPKEVVQVSDLSVIAAPPMATLTLLTELAAVIRDRQGYVTDVASVKTPVVETATSLGLAEHFAGSHPLAGTHRSGFNAAVSDLFCGKVVYVSPLAGGDTAASEVVDFWRRVMDADPIVVDAAGHDSTLAWTSHLPQTVASALAAALSEDGPRGASLGPGALSTTRLANSSVQMWTDILLLNKSAVIDALAGLDRQLENLREALSAGDGHAVRDWLEIGNKWRRRQEP
ncbi:MAG: prephenate dehydrogenase [Gemmatimonadales bacterium]